MEDTGSNDDAQPYWLVWGEWLAARFSNIRVNSVGHLVVLVDSLPPFMVGAASTSFGVIADLHCPFLEQVPGQREALEIVALNPAGIIPFGSLRVIPEGQDGAAYSVELRHQVHATMLNKQWLLYYADALPNISSSLIRELQPAVGGTPLLSK